MAHEDEPAASSRGDSEPELEQPVPGGTGRFWKGFTPVQQLALPLIALAVAIGVIAGGAGLMGGGSDDGGGSEGVGDAAPVEEGPQEICQEALERTRRLLRDPADPVATLIGAALIQESAAERLGEASAPALGLGLSGQAAALERLASAYRAGNPGRLRRARASLRRASLRMERAARSEGADACVRLARLLGGRLTTAPG
jgi:hypothetical protein